MKINTSCRMSLEVCAGNVALAERIAEMQNIILDGQKMTAETVLDLALCGIRFTDDDGWQGINRKIAERLMQEEISAKKRLVSDNKADSIPAPAEAKPLKMTDFCSYSFEASPENVALAERIAETEKSLYDTPDMSYSDVIDREFLRITVEMTDGRKEINRKLAEILKDKEKFLKSVKGSNL